MRVSNSCWKGGGKKRGRNEGWYCPKREEAKGGRVDACTLRHCGVISP